MDEKTKGYGRAEFADLYRGAKQKACAVSGPKAVAELRSVLGDDAYKSFANFRRMKYNNNEKWSLLHDKYRLYMKGQKDGVLPNAWMAATPENKLKGYLLNASHPTGKHKAKVIESVLGYNEKNWEKFSDKLYAEVQKSPVVAVNSFTYNRNGDLIKAIKYEVPVIMSGENHRMLKMKTIWQIDDGVKNHRFITASFYKKGK